MTLGDAPGFTRELAELLGLGNYEVRQVVPGDAARKIDSQRYQAELGSLESVSQLRELIGREEGKPVGAIVNLTALGHAPPGSGNRPADRALVLAQSLFHVLKVFEPDLRSSAAEGGGRVLNATALGGHFGLGGALLGSDTVDVSLRETNPARGASGLRWHTLRWDTAGTLGVVKALRRECPELCVRNVDLDLDIGADLLVPRIVEELRLSEGPAEVGYDGRGRHTVALREEPPDWENLGPLPVDAESVVLITGGAYGITADAARWLAAARPRLILVGRSSPQAEAEETAHLEAEALRGHLVRQMRAGGTMVAPRVIEQSVRETLKLRQIRANLAAMESAGAKVEYHALDARDPERFGRLIDGIYARYGRLDGVLHGAGVIEDKLIRDKSAQSFANVFTTKVQSAQVLAEKLRPEGLKFLVFFSSVAARFGNAGQSDYAAANEVLNKLAVDLAGRCPGRVVSINWGPWDAGMVSPALRALYASHGVELIPVGEGLRFLEAELRGWGGRGPRQAPRQAEVVISCSVDAIAAARLER